MWAIGTYGIIKDPEVIYVKEVRKGIFDVKAGNDKYDVLLEKEVKESDLRKIMLRIDFSLQKQELQNEYWSNSKRKQRQLLQN